MSMLTSIWVCTLMVAFVLMLIDCLNIDGEVEIADGQRAWDDFDSSFSSY